MQLKKHETVRKAICSGPGLTRSSCVDAPVDQESQRGWKLYSFHAPEIECIGKGKDPAPYEFDDIDECYRHPTDLKWHLSGVTASEADLAS